MRILIADESVAATKALRPIFGKTSGGPARKRKTGAAAAGQLIISFPSTKRSGRNAEKQDCPCSGLDLADQPELAATILDALGMALVNRGCIDEGGPLIETARGIRERFFVADHPALAASNNSYARLLRERGDYNAAAKAADESVRLNKALFGDQGLPVAASLNERGVTELAQGRYAEAEQTAIEGLRITARLGASTIDPNVTRLLDLRGRAETELNKLTEAAATYKDVLAQDEKELGTKKHPKYASHLANAGRIVRRQGDLAGAAKIYDEAVQLFEKSLNRPCHPNLADAYANLGTVLRKRGKQEKAGALFGKALRLSEQIRGPLHPLVAQDHANVGRWEYDQGQTKAAEASFGKAVEIFRKGIEDGRVPEENVFYAEANTWYGRVLVEGSSNATRAAKAEKPLENAVLNWPKYPGLGTAGQGVAKACLGHALFLQNKDLPRARQLLEEALPVIIEALGANNAFVIRAQGWSKEAGGSSPGAATQSPPPAKKRKR